MSCAIHGKLWSHADSESKSFSTQKVSKGLRKMRRLRSYCTCAKYHPDICSSFIHSVASNYSVSAQWRPYSNCVDAQGDLSLRYPHMTWRDVFAWRGLNKNKVPSSWCLGRIAVCDCGTPWTFLLPFLLDDWAGEHLVKFVYDLRGIDTHLDDITLSKLVLSPSEKESTLKQKNLLKMGKSFLL